MRKAVSADVTLILSLIRELAEYEREPNAVHSTKRSLLQDCFGSNPILNGLLAFSEGNPAGMALYYYYYSTWAGRRGIFLEDLFVRPDYRRIGVGKALMTELARVAMSQGCHALRWEVLDWNRDAMRFYKRFGSRFRNGWKVMQLAGPDVKRLAYGGAHRRRAKRIA